ncbi:Co2+/Mg2+ efflux protein ApaG [Candidatus Persebacteraceae bacterium Df01]|jgi:ApaG protein|uniref:Co2+/Mg2+ efflux protein ApaG n=1 Tax=Candidatus Doriopsillibacter californiensis TaxID=2970740 RepID=A0ABT7QJB7_9GAMM|nr:Co2+/Mg2+ efflux protein ApaG [Candidatus Persebacteraceae bacterium Df01]
MVSALTDAVGAKVEVLVKANYLPHANLVDGGEFIFAYEITICNVGNAAFQLLSRAWKITDGNGDIREVRGDGVIGKQPRITPDTTFCYTSYVDMPTPAGSMTGVYTMRLDDGSHFDAAIPIFSLVVPSMVN